MRVDRINCVAVVLIILQLSSCSATVRDLSSKLSRLTRLKSNSDLREANEVFVRHCPKCVGYPESIEAAKRIAEKRGNASNVGMILSAFGRLDSIADPERFVCSLEQIDQLAEVERVFIQFARNPPFSEENLDRPLNRMVMQMIDRYVNQCAEQIREGIENYRAPQSKIMITNNIEAAFEGMSIFEKFHKPQQDIEGMPGELVQTRETWDELINELKSKDSSESMYPKPNPKKDKPRGKSAQLLVKRNPQVDLITHLVSPLFEKTCSRVDEDQELREKLKFGVNFAKKVESLYNEDWRPTHKFGRKLFLYNLCELAFIDFWNYLDSIRSESLGSPTKLDADALSEMLHSAWRKSSDSKTIFE